MQTMRPRSLEAPTGWPWLAMVGHGSSTAYAQPINSRGRAPSTINYPDPAAVHRRAELFLSSVSWATMARVRRALGQMSLSSHPVASLCLSKKTLVRPLTCRALPGVDFFHLPFRQLFKSLAGHSS